MESKILGSSPRMTLWVWLAPHAEQGEVDRTRSVRDGGGW